MIWCCPCDNIIMMDFFFFLVENKLQIRSTVGIVNVIQMDMSSVSVSWLKRGKNPHPKGTTQISLSFSILPIIWLKKRKYIWGTNVHT